MAILPDFLRPNLTVVFCGTAAGLKSAERSHYYAGRGNEFWNFLFQGGFTSTRLQPADDSRILEFNLGLTDLAQIDRGTQLQGRANGLILIDGVEVEIIRSVIRHEKVVPLGHDH